MILNFIFERLFQPTKAVEAPGAVCSAMRRRFFRSWFTVVVLLAVALSTTSVAVQARTVLDLDARSQPVSLSDWGDYVIDAESAMTAEQVATDASLKWAPTLIKGIYPLDVVLLALAINLWAWRRGDRFGGWLLLRQRRWRSAQR